MAARFLHGKEHLWEAIVQSVEKHLETAAVYLETAAKGIIQLSITA